jgi:quercetin dioxygenase-like cupin family protein
MSTSETAFRTRDGGSVRFVRTAAETGGDLLEMRVAYAASAAAPPLHLHPEQEERFEVVRGELWARIGDREATYGPGGRFVVPARTPHAMRPVGQGGAEVVWAIRPALESEAFFRVAWGLDPDAPGARRPGLLRSVALARRFSREFQVCAPPPSVQRLLFAVLGPVATWAGHVMPPRTGG